MRRINITVDKEIGKLLDYLKNKKGMTYSGAVKVGLNLLKDEETKKAPVKLVEEDPKMAKVMEEFRELENEKYSFCPHCGDPVIRCTHMEDGQALEALKRVNGLPNNEKER